MSGFSRTAMATLIVIACTTVFVRADDKDDIKAAGKAFHAALSAGDVPAAKKHMISDEKSDKFLEAIAGLTSSKKKLTDAAVAKFGEEGKTIISQGRTPASVNVDQNLEDADIEVTGDTATVTGKNAQGRPIMFKKDGGEWKVDFSEQAKQDQVERGLPIMEKLATAMSETATDINGGKYETLQEAKAGFHQKLAAAMGFPAGGRPGGPTGKP